MQVAIEKPPIPLIWLDTSVLIEMARVRAGEVADARVAERGRRLQESLRECVASRRVLCPEGDQREEYDQGPALVPRIQEIQAELSLGVTFLHRRGIEDNQIAVGMKTFVQGKNAVELSYRDAFYRDPMEAIREGRVGRVQFQRPEEWIQRHIRIRNNIHEEWEQLRQELGAAHRTFEEQLVREKDGVIEAYGTQFAAGVQRLGLGRGLVEEDLGAFWALGLYLAYWKRLQGKPPGLDGLTRFLRSDYYWDLPVPHIRAHLGARLMTAAEPIQRGDSMDLGCLSAVLPYCQLVLTDRKMRDHLRFLKFDRKYQTRVLALQDYEQALGLLEGIR